MKMLIIAFAESRLTRRTDGASVYVMNTKLTLRMDDLLIKRAKAAARRRGKSVSQMVSEFVDSLDTTRGPTPDLPPVTASLLGRLKGRRVSESTYRKHLREKYG